MPSSCPLFPANRDDVVLARVGKSWWPAKVTDVGAERAQLLFFGDFKVPGFAPKLTETESSVAWLGPPDVGAHNSEIYGDLLGMNEDELKTLAADGII